MKLIVQKFGGTSISTVKRILKISKIITQSYDNNYNIVAVVSAQGNTTDKLIAKMRKINEHPSKREMDVLLSTGEQISISLLAAAIESMGYPAISLTGWQSGFETDSNYQNARIKKINVERLQHELNQRKIVIVAGFQGVDKDNNITTLGRGGSDTSAVALAISLNADFCQIFTDVDGIYTADPRLVKNAKKINEITFDEMLEMSSLGAQILHNRSVEMAKNYKIPIDVLSSLIKKPGTRVKEVVKMEKKTIRGIARDNNISIITIKNLKNSLHSKCNILSTLSDNNIPVYCLSLNETFKTDELCFSIPADKKNETITLLNTLNLQDINIIDNISKISIIGSGLLSNCEVLSNLFETLSNNNIHPYLISTGEISISIIVDEKISIQIMNLLHDSLKLDSNE